MMTEISLNVLDVAENSVRAKATIIEITIQVDTSQDILEVIIKDNGCGMTKEQVANVEDPFFTTRTTRKVGLGIPFYKYAALSTGGSFSIESTVGVGTIVKAVFRLSHIDCMPLGDITSTMHALITLNAQIDFIYTYGINDRNFRLDTREFREILGDIAFNTPEVSSYIKEFLIEHKSEVDNGTII